MTGRPAIWHLLICALMLSCPVLAQGQPTLEPFHITFEGPPTLAPGTSEMFIDDYSEQGMLITGRTGTNSSGYFSRTASGSGGRPDNGTTHARGSRFTCSFTNGSMFDLESVDVAELNAGFPGPVTVQFSGFRHDGSTVTTNFTSDGIIDGTGPLADFETVRLQGFTLLARLEISGACSLDNLIGRVLKPDTNTAAPVALIPIGHAEPPSRYVESVAISGGFAYIAVFGDGFRVYDITDPARPQPVGHVGSNEIYTTVAVSGDVAVLGAARSPVTARIIDISKAEQPVFAGGIGGYRSGRCGVAISGRYAFVNTGNLEIYDISDPYNPVKASETTGVEDESENHYGIALSGNLALLTHQSGLSIYDVFDVTAPGLQATVNGWFDDVAVSGSFAFVSGAAGLTVLDISDPLQPRIVGKVKDGPLSSRGLGVAVSGHLVFMANGSDGLRVYDVSIPWQPKPVAHMAVEGYSRDVTVSGSLVYLANGTGGLRILKAAPQLVVRATNRSAEVILSWSRDGDMVLQHSSDPTGSTWQDVSCHPVELGSWRCALLPAVEEAMFYRLRATP